MAISNEDIESVILKEVEEFGSIKSTIDLAGKLKIDHQLVIGSLKSLEADLYVRSEIKYREFWQLSDEAIIYIESGTPEYQVYSKIPVADLISIANLQNLVDKNIYKIGFSKCMANKWIAKEGDSVRRVNMNANDDVRAKLTVLHTSQGSLSTLPVDSQDAKTLLSRKLIKYIKLSEFVVTKEVNFAPKRVKLESDFTKEILDKELWKTCKFKDYNFDAFGKDISSGCLHPLLKVREEFRSILLSTGFSEMPTNQYVESSFWNFDSLYQPQAHPSRDAQDTFFIKDPANTIDVPEDYLNRVSIQHEFGGNGSFGYGTVWKREEAMKNILRTHTTSVSAKMLYDLVKDGKPFHPVKYFSIDRVYRNETLDSTHLAEFHQVELFYVDYDLSLGHLIGMINDFFNSIGIYDLKFKPAYNPYTEPSMEIFGYHPDLKRWTEIGNSGVFRPEMILPMGLPKDVRVVACGLSLERPTMIKYGIKNIRDLFGQKFDLNMSRNIPLPRF